MLYTYAHSITGTSHIAGGTVCQDFSGLKKLPGGRVIAAVADGVGSAARADTGAKIAVETVLAVCEQLLPDSSDIPAVMRAAYHKALQNIVGQAEADDRPLPDYDTTLTAVIYDGVHLYYGHSGDGGIIGLDLCGNYTAITAPQQDTDGISVMPLRAGASCWVFGGWERQLSAVLLVTDGVLNALMPYLLKNSAPNLYIPLCSFFIDPVWFAWAGDEEACSEKIKRFLNKETTPDEFYEILSRAYARYYPTQEQADQAIHIIRKGNAPFALAGGITDDKTA
ncbi:MAG: protein phosphatase 2C domain-containing protein, partial [Oscillospiraceae bacterium]|nr:protein phosphatase 2C domain-containing protein [Oscillospiraceae bacterium]